MVDSVRSHPELAESIREGVGGPGLTDPQLRVGAMARAGGGPAITEPFDALTRQIAEASYRVTDAQVAAVRETVGSDKGAFEVVLSASIGAGLTRWDAAMRAIEGASDATA